MATLPRTPGTFAASAFFGPRSVDRAERAHPGEADVPVCDHATLLASYADLAPRVQRFLRDLLGCPTTAADATQETFVRAFRKVDGVPAGTRLAPWVFGIARHVSLEMRRARGRARRLIETEAPGASERVADPSMRTPEAELLDREALAVVDRALDRLPEDRRAALLLRLDHGLAYEEIAQSMGWSLAKAKVEVFRAREVLRDTLAEYRGGAS